MLDPLLQPILIPLAAGLLCLVLPARWDRARAWLTVAGCAVTLLAAAGLAAGGPQARDFGGGFPLRMDALSQFMVPAACAMALLTAVYALETMRDHPGLRTYDGCLLSTLGLACGSLLANHLLILLVGWGGLAVTLYLMIRVSSPTAAPAARKSLLIVGGSDALLLLGVALVWIERGHLRMDAAPLELAGLPATVAFLAFGAAAFAKAGAIPLHSWIPDCGEQAHASVTAFLPASLDKILGIYLLFRAATGLFVPTGTMNTLLMSLGTLTILAAVLMALVQHNLKRLLAFHAVSQVGYMVLGIGTGTPVGLAGGLFHMLNNALYKTCLFYGAGVVEQKTGTVELNRLGGLATRLPLTFGVCLVAALAISGIPPLNGFTSKWMVYQGVVEAGLQDGGLLWTVWLAAAVLGSALTLASFIKVLHAVFLCKPSPHIQGLDLRPAGWATALPMGVLAGLCILFGVFAREIPLPWMIVPAIGEPVVFSGAWWAAPIAALLLLVFLLGAVVYAITLRCGGLRRCPTYIGGEDLGARDQPLPGQDPPPYVEVTGVDFYRTVQELPGLRRLYAGARRRCFDIYALCAHGSAYTVRLLRSAHTGLLPFYLTWFLIGLLAVLYWMEGGTP